MTKLGLWWLLLIPAGEWASPLGHHTAPASSHLEEGTPAGGIMATAKAAGHFV